MKDLKEINIHLETVNRELGCVKTDIAVIKNDIKWIKTWGIGILVIIQVVVSVVINKIL